MESRRMTTRRARLVPLRRPRSASTTRTRRSRKSCRPDARTWWRMRIGRGAVGAEKQWYTGILEKLDAWIDPLPTMRAILDLDKLGCNPDEIARGWPGHCLLGGSRHLLAAVRAARAGPDPALPGPLYQYSDPKKKQPPRTVPRRSPLGSRWPVSCPSIRSCRCASESELGLFGRGAEDAAVQVPGDGAVAPG